MNKSTIDTVEIMGNVFKKEVIDKIYNDPDNIKELLNRQEDRLSSASELSIDIITQLFLFIIKSLLLMNGMAIISIITYIGNTNSMYSNSLIEDSILYFSLGMVFSIISAASHIVRLSKSQDILKTNSKEEIDKIIKKSNSYEFVTYFITIISLVFFIVGSFNATKAITYKETTNIEHNQTSSYTTTNSKVDSLKVAPLSGSKVEVWE